MVDGTEIVSSLATVRDFVEEARIATDAESQQSSLRRAHAAVSKTERGYYALAEHLRHPVDPGSWRQRKVTMNEFNFYVLLAGLLALLATLAFTNHFFAVPCAFWAVWIIVSGVRTRSSVKKAYAGPGPGPGVGARQPV